MVGGVRSFCTSSLDVLIGFEDQWANKYVNIPTF